jgi:hypothetical protein
MLYHIQTCHANENCNGPPGTKREHQSAVIKSQLESTPGREKQKKKEFPNARNVQNRWMLDASIPSKRVYRSENKKETMERTNRHQNPDPKKTKEKPNEMNLDQP